MIIGMPSIIYCREAIYIITKRREVLQEQGEIEPSQMMITEGVGSLQT